MAKSFWRPLEGSTEKRTWCSLLCHNLTEENAKGGDLRDNGSQLRLNFRNRKVEDIALESKIPRHVVHTFLVKF